MNIKTINDIAIININSFNNIKLQNINSINNVIQNYAFNLNLDTLKDSVSGNSLSCIYGGTRYDEVNGIQTAFTSLQPVVTEKGIRSVGSYQNLFSNSENITQWGSQNITYIDTQHFVATATSGSFYKSFAPIINNNYIFGFKIKIASGTNFNNYIIRHSNYSLNGTNLPILTSEYTQHSKSMLPTSTTTIICGIRDSNAANFSTINVTQLFLIKNKYLLPYIPTTDSAATSTTESGTASAGEATNGAYLENVATNFPALKSSLESKGTIQFNWTPAYNQADVTGNLNILAFNANVTTDAIYYDATNGLLKVNDGTNTASCVLNAVANTTYSIKISYDNTIGMKVFVDETSGDLTDFDGFTVGTDIIYGLDNVELHYTKDLKVLKTASWS